MSDYSDADEDMQNMIEQDDELYSEEDLKSKES
jgi:hypothetical protein